MTTKSKNRKWSQFSHREVKKEMSGYLRSGEMPMQGASVLRSLKERQRLERENLILEVAEAVFVEKGYHETSMDEIAARVGVANG